MDSIFCSVERSREWRRRTFREEQKNSSADNVEITGEIEISRKQEAWQNFVKPDTYHILINEI